MKVRRHYVGIRQDGTWVISVRIDNQWVNFFGPMSKEAADYMLTNVGNPACRHELDAEIAVSALEEY